MNGQARARSRPRGVTVAGVVLLVSGALLALGGIYDLVAGESASRPFGTLFDVSLTLHGLIYLVIGLTTAAAGWLVLRLSPAGRRLGIVMGLALLLLGVLEFLSSLDEGFNFSILMYLVIAYVVVSRLRREAFAFAPRVEVVAAAPLAAPPDGARGAKPLISLRGLKKHFPITRGILFQRKVGAVHAVDGIDLDVYPGETIGLVGETGCGKSTTARLMMRLFDATEGTIEFDGQDITHITGADLRALRREMQMIFQDPYASLNPRKPVGAIIGDPMGIHKIVAKGKVKGEVQQLMELVGLNPEHYNRYPHEFSGGQRQRIGVARALALKPKVVVADEPVSALDVSIQAQILNLLEDLQEELNLTYVFIAHDLSVVKHVSDRVAVMYLGRIVEVADGDTLYLNPKHPYTGALLSAVPIPDPDLAAKKKRIILEGDVPSPIDPPSGCRFHPRCPRAQFPKCKEDDPVLTPHHEGQVAACHFPLEDRAVIETVAAP